MVPSLNVVAYPLHTSTGWIKCVLQPIAPPCNDKLLFSCFCFSNISFQKKKSSFLWIIPRQTRNSFSWNYFLPKKQSLQNQLLMTNLIAGHRAAIENEPLASTDTFTLMSIVPVKKLNVIQLHCIEVEAVISETDLSKRRKIETTMICMMETMRENMNQPF